MNKTDFRRMIDDRKEPEWLRREVDHALRSREEIHVNRAMRNRGLTLERKLPESFKSLYKRFKKENAQENSKCASTAKKVKKITSREARALGLAFHIVMKEAREKKLIEHAASLQGKSVNEYLIECGVTKAEKDIHGERVYGDG